MSSMKLLIARLKARLQGGPDFKVMKDEKDDESSQSAGSSCYNQVNCQANERADP